MSLSGVTCNYKLDKRRVFPDETFNLETDIANNKFVPVWLRVRLAVNSAIRLAANKAELSQQCGLLWHQRVSFNWDMIALKRGLYPIGPPVVSTGDLLGFFPQEKKETAMNIIVYPRIVPLKPFELEKKDLFGVPGKKSPVQDPIYILGTRDYQHSQPARNIHWKASARHSRLQEKIFDPSEQEKVLLVIDVEGFAQHQAEAEFEKALEVLASMAALLDRQGFAYGLVTNGTVKGGKTSIVPMACNPQQLTTILEILARLQMKAENDILAIFKQDTPLPWGVSCAMFDYAADSTTYNKEAYLRYRKVPTTFLLSRLAPSHETNPNQLKSPVCLLDDLYDQSHMPI
ncbi:DUF58 domain-containing protein [Thermodesulfobacteriota bacterium]